VFAHNLGRSLVISIKSNPTEKMGKKNIKIKEKI
jgi:hypothetical protein